jgi:hypothetical protein
MRSVGCRNWRPQLIQGGKIMSDFDWVTALLACSPNKVFEMLKGQIREDVRIRNGLLSQHTRYTFTTTGDGETLTVLIESDTDHRSVTFSLTRKGIAVRDEKDKPILEAAFTLNDKGECRPEIEGKECEFWQLRMKALKQLFVLC